MMNMISIVTINIRNTNQIPIFVNRAYKEQMHLRRIDRHFFRRLKDI